MHDVSDVNTGNASHQPGTTRWTRDIRDTTGNDMSKAWHMWCKERDCHARIDDRKLHVRYNTFATRQTDAITAIREIPVLRRPEATYQTQETFLMQRPETTRQTRDICDMMRDILDTTTPIGMPDSTTGNDMSGSRHPWGDAKHQLCDNRKRHVRHVISVTR